MSINRGMCKDVVPAYNGRLLSLKNEQMPLAATGMDRKFVILREVKQEDKYILSLICGIFFF